jgi:hypothetical protein
MPITKEIIRDIKQETGVTAFFETGLLGGETFGHALDLGFEKVCSIEIKQEFVDRALRRYSQWVSTGVANPIADDSSNLGEYLSFVENHKCLFWLDAHLDSGLETAVKMPLTSCPLRKELEGIKKSKRNDHVIMVDDLRILTNQDYHPWQNGKLNLTSEKFTLEIIKNMILEINPEYQFKTIDGYLLPFRGREDQILKNDVLVAVVP